MEFVDKDELLRILKHCSVYNQPCPEWVYGVINSLKTVTIVSEEISNNKV